MFKNSILYFWIAAYMISNLLGLGTSYALETFTAEPVISKYVYNKIIFNPNAKLKILFSPGGEVNAHRTIVNVMWFLRRPVMIVGPCYSACTFFTRLESIKGSCASPTATLYFHRARTMTEDGQVISLADDQYTKEMMKWYPKDVQDWIISQGGLPKYDPAAWLEVPAVKFFKPCDPEEMKHIDPTKN
jgi:hypothetical protein